MACRLDLQLGRPRGIAADGRDATAARAGNLECSPERALRRALAERAEHGDGLARPVRDAIHAHLEIELGLDTCERGLVPRRDEDGLCRQRRPPRLARQRVAGLRQGRGAERRVDLRDPEPVQPRDALERATRLRHDLGPDSVPGQARDRVGRPAGHAATS